MWMVVVNSDGYGEHWNELYDSYEEALEFVEDYKNSMYKEDKLYVVKIEYEVNGSLEFK